MLEGCALLEQVLCSSCKAYFVQEVLVELIADGRVSCARFLAELVADESRNSALEMKKKRLDCSLPHVLMRLEHLCASNCLGSSSTV